MLLRVETEDVLTEARRCVRSHNALARTGSTQSELHPAQMVRREANKHLEGLAGLDGHLGRRWCESEGRRDLEGAATRIVAANLVAILGQVFHAARPTKDVTIVAVDVTEAAECRVRALDETDFVDDLTGGWLNDGHVGLSQARYHQEHSGNQVTELAVYHFPVQSLSKFNVLLVDVC